MELTFEELREKEVINLVNGKNLGRITDVLFDINKGNIKGIFVAGEKKIFKKNEDVFIMLSQIYKFGDDIIMVNVNEYKNYQKQVYGDKNSPINNKLKANIISKNKNFVRYRRINNNKYK